MSIVAQSALTAGTYIASVDDFPATSEQING